MNHQSTFKVPKNLRKPLTEEEKQERLSHVTMNYVCHLEVPIGLHLEKLPVIRRFINKLLKYFRL
ncbi:MAG: hypothetical protein HRT51_05480 [Colwellia sp.]|nr:hypothetical protein [Colwellia sp.]